MARAKVRFNTKHAVSVMRRASDEAIQQVMHEVLEEAREEAPLDKGDLRASGHIVQNGPTTKIVFDAPYAEIQHENLSYHHDIGKAKYLEDPFNRAVPRLYPRAQKKVNDAFGK